MSVQSEQSVAITYDLLSRTERLDASQIGLLQENLNQLGFDSGTVDGIMGRNTAAAIAGFLKDSEHQVFAPQISEDMRGQLVQYGQGGTITYLQAQATMAPEEFQNTPLKIEELLQSETLNRAEITELQDLLKVAGYEPGVSDGYFGANTASAITNYMTDNPEALLQADPARLQEMMRYGQTDALRDLAGDNKEAFDVRIHEQLAAMGADQDISALTHTTDYEAAYELQTLLSIGGYSPGGLDGIIGNKTLGAVKRFEDEALLPAGLQAKPDSAAPEPTSPSAPETQEQPPEITIPGTTGTVVSQNVTKLYDGENGFGVPNLAIERAWGRITGEDIPEEYNQDETGEALSNARPLIVIDLGHGSDINSNDRIDMGAVSQNGLTEVDVVDPLSEAMAERLYAQGYQVAFTRNPGEQLRVEGTHGETLRVRPDFANALQDELNASSVVFVSMHANSFTKESANGTRIYVDVDDANITNENSGVLADSLAENFNISSTASSVKHAGNLSVIDRFENTVDSAINAGALVELGFLSNTNDAEALEKIRDNPAEAATQIVAGIENYIESVMPGQQDKPDHIATAQETSAPTNTKLPNAFEPG